MKQYIYLFFCVALLTLSACGDTTNPPIPPVNAQDTIPTRDDNMALGNPSNAATDPNSLNNYLMVKPQFVLSYNSSKGEANWASWHLSRAWKGTAARQDDFRKDPELPSNFFSPSSTSYSGSGYDRGHLCPSDDRDGSIADNSATFVMTNMIPQAPNLNRISWLALEDYGRKLITEGKEMYIVAGGYGTGGVASSTSSLANTINNGQIEVPAYTWKILVVLPVGKNDLSRITADTRVIAVAMPNRFDVNDLSWGNYRVSVDALEQSTGLDFLSAVPVGIQAAIESKVDTGATN